ncbi:MAG: hypothetical protein IPG15_09855 [Arcobacter sp.]|nr:hypothetical protein [Arcobacter sp.]
MQVTSEQLKNNTSNGYILIIVEIIEGNTFGINSILLLIKMKFVKVMTIYMETIFFTKR